MIELALASISIFGLGDWMCVSRLEYGDGMQETIETRVTTYHDLSFEEVQTLSYQMASDNTVSKLKVFVSGYKEVIGSAFIAHPQEVAMTVELDERDMFTPEFLNMAEAFFLETSQLIEVVDLNADTMTLRLQKTGKETTCQASSGGA
ncbi:hypothetical protein HW452_15600 [Halomonas aquamarina]|uniref:Uncharacterized protein n=1 Tax=Vreelandella aquamarina TaxID=77097 RepID=A0ACC5VZL7_9GAMM|nr:hypothetical protein [Halomonas aquamarina]MBZ5488949.1 hypothetical protein [Halomonas aquamarina]